MSPRIAIIIALYLYGGTMGAAERPSLDQTSDLSSRANLVDSCFANKLATYAVQHPALPARYSSETTMYVSERIVATTRFNEDIRKFEGPIFSLSSEDFCDTVLFQPYVTALPLAAAEMNNKSAGALAPLGTDAVESTSILVEKYQNLIGRHYKGHSDLTAEALKTFATVETEFSPQAKELVRKASQTPDLYRWNDSRFHAHTPEYSWGDSTTRRQRTAEGRLAYANLMCRLVRALVREVDLHNYENGLFLLGVMSHSAQDLTYHHGMTMSQHAGLSYAVDRNPDLPSDPVAVRLEREAISNTLWILNRSRERVSPAAWSRMAKWTPPGSFALSNTASRVYGSEGGSPSQDIDTQALLDYWLLALPYSLGIRPKSDLVETACTADTGLVCWSIADVRGAVESELARGQQCN